jgi:hypothetical protein
MPHNFYMKKIILCITLCASPLISYGIEAMDNYYSNDLLGAVDEAREKPHHYDYSNTYRYKRTTAQSINLNRIDLDELENTRLDIAATGNESSTEDILEIHPNTEITQDDQRFKLNNTQTHKTFTHSQFILQNTGVARSTNGATSSSGISNQSTLISTSRP